MGLEKKILPIVFSAALGIAGVAGIAGVTSMGCGKQEGEISKASRKEISLAKKYIDSYIEKRVKEDLQLTGRDIRYRTDIGKAKYEYNGWLAVLPLTVSYGDRHKDRIYYYKYKNLPFLSTENKGECYVKLKVLSKDGKELANIFLSYPFERWGEQLKLRKPKIESCQ